jgi:hypothetical protein
VAVSSASNVPRGIRTSRKSLDSSEEKAWFTGQLRQSSERNRKQRGFHALTAIGVGRRGEVLEMSKPVSIGRFIKAIQALPSDEPRVYPKKWYTTQKSIGLVGSRIIMALGHTVAIRKPGEMRNTFTIILLR